MRSISGSTIKNSAKVSAVCGIFGADCRRKGTNFVRSGDYYGFFRIEKIS